MEQPNSSRFDSLTPSQREALANSLEQRFQNTPDLVLISAGPTGYTAAMLASEIRQGTPFGKEFVDNFPPDDDLEAPDQPGPLEDPRKVIADRMRQVQPQLDALLPGRPE